MSSPRSGFRRAAVASWALAGLGVAGVAGASALAYGDTLKPVADAAPQAVDPIVDAVPLTQAPVPQVPVAPAPELPAQQAPVQQAPVQQTYAPPPAAAAPQQTVPQQTYVPEQPVAPAYAPTYAPQPAVAAPAPMKTGGLVGGSSSSVMGGSSSPYTGGGSSSSNTSTRQSHIPMGSNSGPNKAVPHTTARGS